MDVCIVGGRGSDEQSIVRTIWNKLVTTKLTSGISLIWVPLLVFGFCFFLIWFVVYYYKTYPPPLLFVVLTLSLPLFNKQVPAWVTKRWLHTLSKEYPTLAFHASITNPFGKGSLLSLLRQLARLRSDKQYISVGMVGYPNVGKSSVINTLRSKKVCNVAPIPGETKVWQYITLMKRIFLIDCPGVVYNKTDDSETDIVLKGVVRVENLVSRIVIFSLLMMMMMINKRRGEL